MRPAIVCVLPLYVLSPVILCFAVMCTFLFFPLVIASRKWTGSLGKHLQAPVRESHPKKMSMLEIKSDNDEGSDFGQSKTGNI